MNGTIGFGKYSGQEIEDIPTDYLQWLLETLEDNGRFANKNPRLYEAVEEELAIRERSDAHFYERDM